MLRKESAIALGLAAILLGLVMAVSSPVEAARPGFGNLYYNDTIVRTVVPPAASPQSGRDNLYVVMDGVADQLAVAAVGPGDRDYHGGQWAFHRVTWNTSPYLLTSAAAVLAAAGSGDVTIERIADNDFKCPIQR